MAYSIPHCLDCGSPARMVGLIKLDGIFYYCEACNKKIDQRDPRVWGREPSANLD